MNNIFKNHLEKFVPPPEIDRSILSAAKFNLAWRRRRARLVRLCTGAAAACFVFGVIFLYSSEMQRKRQEEARMLSMWDFSKVESEMYRLDMTIDNSKTTLANL